jgi:hypothetical protein
MISTLVLDAPTGSAGAGCVGASGRLRGTAAPWAALRDRSAVATGGAMPAGSRLVGAAAPSVVLTREIAVGVHGTEPVPAVRPIQLFATTHPYSTLGNHSPGRPQS